MTIKKEAEFDSLSEWILALPNGNIRGLIIEITGINKFWAWEKVRLNDFGDIQLSRNGQLMVKEAVGNIYKMGRLNRMGGLNNQLYKWLTFKSDWGFLRKSRKYKINIVFPFTESGLANYNSLLDLEFIPNYDRYKKSVPGKGKTTIYIY